MATTHDSPPQIAVWYFVGASFVFSSTTLLFPEPDLWLRVATLVVGFLLVVVGGIQLGAELRRRPRKNDSS